MVRRKERLGKGEKSIIQRKELHSEPCWCELYESEKWRTIKIWKYALWAKNMVFKSSDWRMIMPQFLPLAEKKKPRPSYLNFFLFRVTLGRELCVLSPSTPRPDPAVCPKLSLTVPARIASTTMEEAEESPGSPWDWVFRENKKKKLFCVWIPWGTVSTSACRATAPLLSADWDCQVKEGGTACPDSPFFSVISHSSA